MTNDEEPMHEEQLPCSDNRPRKNQYQAPKLITLKSDQTKSQLVARARAGDRDAEELLKLVLATAQT